MSLGNSIPTRIVPLLALVAAVVCCLFGASHAAAATVNDSLELRIAHSSLPAGSEETVSGKLVSLSGKPIRNGKVLIEYAYPNEGPTPITEFTTSTTGTFAHGYKVPTTVFFRAYFTGGGSFTPFLTKWLKVTTTKGVPADGTEYIDPHTGCAWVVENGAWVGKICESQQVDSSGNPIEDMYDLYEFNAASSNHVGNYMAELYTGDPTFNEYRIPNNVVFETVQWAAVPKNNPTAEPVWEVALGGQWAWVSTAQMKQLLGAQQAAAAGQAAAPPASDTITIPNDWNTTLFGDFFNGIDHLGGNVQLGETFSKLYSLGISEPFTPGVCGEVNYTCWAD